MTGSTVSQIGVEGIHRYTMSVADLDQSVKWYRDKLGLKLILLTEIRENQRAAYMQGPGFILEMYYDSKANPLPPYRSHPATDNPVQGHKHFSVLVENGPQAEKELRALDLPILFIPVVGDTYGIFIADPTGNVMEVLQERTPRRPPDPDRPPGAGPIEILGPSHAAISVANIDASVEWYTEKLGFSFQHSVAIPRPDGEPVTITWLRAPDFSVELFGVPGSSPLPRDRLDPFTDLKTRGNKYFSLGVVGLETAESQLRALGVEVIAFSTQRCCRSLYIRDNTGNVIELFQLVY
jgi:methylmalonyl-CoA/ethylmalonyl-CoA epimerase